MCVLLKTAVCMHACKAACKCIILYTHIYTHAHTYPQTHHLDVLFNFITLQVDAWSNEL